MHNAPKIIRNLIDTARLIREEMNEEAKRHEGLHSEKGEKVYRKLKKARAAVIEARDLILDVSVERYDFGTIEYE